MRSNFLSVAMLDITAPLCRARRQRPKILPNDGEHVVERTDVRGRELFADEFEFLLVEERRLHGHRELAADDRSNLDVNELEGKRSRRLGRGFIVKGHDDLRPATGAR